MATVNAEERALRARIRAARPRGWKRLELAVDDFTAEGDGWTAEYWYSEGWEGAVPACLAADSDTKIGALRDLARQLEAERDAVEIARSVGLVG